MITWALAWMVAQCAKHGKDVEIEAAIFVITALIDLAVFGFVLGVVADKI